MIRKGAICFRGKEIPCDVDAEEMAGWITYLRKGEIIGTVPLGKAAPAEFDAVRINPAESWLLVGEPN